MWPRRRTTTVSTRSVVKVLTISLAFLGVLYLIYRARTPIIWTLTAFFLALALNPAVDWTTRRMPRRSRLLGTGAVFVALLSVFAMIAVLLVPPLIQQTDQLIRNLPAYTASLTDPASPAGRLVVRYDLVDQVRQRQDQLVGSVSFATGSVAGLLRNLLSSVVGAVTVLTLTFFMLLESPLWVRRFWALQRADHRARNQRLASEMYRAVTGYVNGKLLMAAIAAVPTMILLALLGVPYAIALGIIVGLFDLIPLIGATIGAAIVILVSLFTSTTAAIVMFVFFIVYQQIENNVLQPIIFGRSVQVSALLVLVSILIGAAIGGILGALVAIPVTASLQILIKDLVGERIRREAPASK